MIYPLVQPAPQQAAKVARCMGKHPRYPLFLLFNTSDYFRSHSPGPYEINRTRTRDSDVIPPPMMLHYLLSMMASRPAGGGTRGPDFLQNLFPVGAQDGRWGDYVFNQEGTWLCFPLCY